MSSLNIPFQIYSPYGKRSPLFWKGFSLALNTCLWGFVFIQHEGGQGLWSKLCAGVFFTTNLGYHAFTELSLCTKGLSCLILSWVGLLSFIKETLYCTSTSYNDFLYYCALNVDASYMLKSIRLKKIYMSCSHYRMWPKTWHEFVTTHSFPKMVVFLSKSYDRLSDMYLI